MARNTEMNSLYAPGEMRLHGGSGVTTSGSYLISDTNVPRFTYRQVFETWGSRLVSATGPRVIRTALKGVRIKAMLNGNDNQTAGFRVWGLRTQCPRGVPPEPDLGTADADNVTITPELICTVATATASTRTGSGSQALPSGWRMADTLSTATISARYTDMFNAFGSPATIVSSSAASNADDAVLIIPDVFDSGMLAIDGLIGTATAVDWLVEVLR